MIGRLIASYFLLKQYEPEYIYSSNHYVSFKTFLKGITKDNFGIFVIFVSLISFATAVSGPFFAVYMLKHLNFTYIQFTIVTVGSVLTTILFLPFWGKFSDKYGNIEVIKMTGVLIAITPLLWAMTFFLTNLNINTIVVYLVFVEFFSGFIWSGFNLSSAIFIYDAISKEKIAASTTYFNIINSFGATIGAILGGLIGSLSFSIFGIDTIIWIMILSSVLRIIIALLINPKIKEVRNVPNFEFKNKIKNGLKKRGAFIWRYIGFKAIRIN